MFTTTVIISLLLLTAIAKDCPPGRFLKGTECKHCRRGTYNSIANAKRCRKCPAGTTSDEASNNLADCVPCDWGTFASKPGSRKCIECPINTYAYNKGSVECNKCPAGYFARAGRHICEICPPGGIINEKGDCDACYPGYTSFTRNAKECFPCKKGFFSDVNDYQCRKCEPGTFSNLNGAIECVKCPRGSYQNKRGQTECINCPRLSKANRGAAFCKPQCGKKKPDCRRCPPGQGVYDNVCQKCPKGTFSDAESSTPCQECEGIMKPNKERTKCFCPKGALNNRYDGCKRCPEGSASKSGEHCECKIGTLEELQFSVFECFCPAGMKKSGKTCKPCSKKELTLSNPACRVCEPLYGQGKSGLCEICPDETDNSEYTFGKCSKCPEGTLGDIFGCRCPKGQQRIGGRKCRKCPAGSYSNETWQRCFRCDYRGYRTFQDKRGQNKCKDCPPGTVTNLVGTGCVKE